MRMVFGLVLILGLGLAGFAVYLARDYMADLEANRVTEGPAIATRDVYVTNRAIRYGEQILPEDVRMVPFPEAAMPEGAFFSEAELFPRGIDMPRSALRSVEKDEALLAVKLTDAGEPAGIAARLTAGMRAFAIEVDVSSGVSGFLRPGDRIDVYWSGSQPTNNGQRKEVTKLIETGVRIVGIDQSADEDRSEAAVARTVTVEATPRQVASLAQAQTTGSLSLSLVGAEDTIVSEAVEIDQRELLGIQEEEQVEVVEQEICTIRTRRGADMVEIPIECTN